MSLLNPPFPFPRRHQAPQLTLAWDLFFFGLVVLLLLVAAGLEFISVPPAAFWLWVIAGVLALVMTQLSAFAEHGSAYLVPLLTWIIAAALLIAVGQAPLILALIPLHLVWLAARTVAQLTLQRRSPPLKLGFLDPPTPELSEALHPQRIQPVMVSSRDPSSLRGLDGLVVRNEPSGQLHHRVLEHAQLMKLSIIPERLLTEDLTGRVSLRAVDQNWVTQAAFQPTYLFWKRGLDVVFTLLAAPVLLPLMALVALVVYFNSGRPILFWQQRVGQDGKPFQLVKFRTMTRDSERAGPAFAKQGDMRITPVGAFLRKFRLDELPQFWNVLRGDMSIIGPRPEQLAFTVEFEESIPMYTSRHWVRPGITGWAQVNQGYTDSAAQITEKLEYDFYYVKHCSAPLDLKIVWKTVLTILTGFGSR